MISTMFLRRLGMRSSPRTWRPTGVVVVRAPKGVVPLRWPPVFM